MYQLKVSRMATSRFRNWSPEPGLVVGVCIGIGGSRPGRWHPFRGAWAFRVNRWCRFAQPPANGWQASGLSKGDAQMHVDTAPADRISRKEIPDGIQRRIPQQIARHAILQRGTPFLAEAGAYSGRTLAACHGGRGFAFSGAVF